ncbi:MAG: hypothetical protein O3B86_07855, partial [Planctomycetota bacterium]|nr:hypothetical protein [Planctomycetota bacterium]
MTQLPQIVLAHGLFEQCVSECGLGAGSRGSKICWQATGQSRDAESCGFQAAVRLSDEVVFSGRAVDRSSESF